MKKLIGLLVITVMFVGCGDFTNSSENTHFASGTEELLDEYPDATANLTEAELQELAERIAKILNE